MDVYLEPNQPEICMLVLEVDEVRIVAGAISCMINARNFEDINPGILNIFHGIRDTSVRKTIGCSDDTLTRITNILHEYSKSSADSSSDIEHESPGHNLVETYKATAEKASVLAVEITVARGMAGVSDELPDDFL